MNTQSPGFSRAFLLCIKYPAMKISCRTLFDITATGVRSHYKSSRMPFRDDSGQPVETQEQWNRSRNQQRNWETVNQIISLRTLPQNITTPHKDQDSWYFEFEVENPAALDLANNPVGALAQDCQGVPMIVNDNVVQALEPGHNIWFDPVMR